MKPSAFSYHAPRTAAEAVGLLAGLGEGAKVLAGGQSLIPLLALRLAAFDHLIDIGRIEEIKGVERHNGALRIGAGTTEARVGSSPEVAGAVPLLARATPLIGHFQIRNRGTLGGAIAHADPAAEYPAVALALDATMEVLSPRGRRSIAAPEFFDGTWSTSLEADELLVGITFPVWTGRCGFAIEELARRAGDFAIAGAVVAVEIDGDDRVARCSIGLFGLGPTPERAAEAEQSVTGAALTEIVPEDLGRLAVHGLDAVPSDLHGSAEYRRRVGAAMVARAWTSAAAEAEAGHA
jgi:carbon-monoxide dehydrogenase medium subunit